ncbi:hypothetical protein [Streptomyces poonensis]|uniref:Integral membrane protein n=1 Tax=Streptomyces poonensis TaxID=68255 RepID=A0A918P833_9ACTN|nr:hypothetical protein [Streptomyces poonensis]GGY89760.1 hypothetical protein GCM10010365_04930 [Streptomyces poonensis]GLJ88070.1 hypothetical protein GCM10017589_06700 [Streptomyces poonensis]
MNERGPTGDSDLGELRTSHAWPDAGESRSSDAGESRAWPEAEELIERGAEDRPQTPTSPAPWDTRPETWPLAAAGETGDMYVRAEPAAHTMRRTPPTGHGAADPVKALLRRHRQLCERAVDPLEIAARLEAHGMTDRAAARFRHRDVFSLAEELYARMPRVEEERTPERGAVDAPDPHAGGMKPAVTTLLPGALCAVTVAGVHLTEGRPRLVTAAVGTLAVLLGLRAALRRGPLRVPSGLTGSTGGPRAWTCWLLAYAFCGDGLLSAALDGGPDGPWPVTTAPVLALALACAPAIWCVRLFAVRARRGLVVSRSLKEFAGLVRPLLLGVLTVFLCALGALLALCATALDEPASYAGGGSLGALLLLALLLTAHGSTHAPTVVLAAAGAGEVTALATVFAGRLPGCSFLTVPVQTVVVAWGAGAVPGLVCGLAALVLLAHATRTLTRASAHALPPGSP